MSATQPSEFRLIPTRAGLNAVAVLQGRNIQAGTAILNLRKLLMLKTTLLAVSIAVATGLMVVGCQTSTPSPNSNIAGSQPANVDPNNLPAGISAQQLEPSANSTPGIPPANAVNALPKGATPTPGIPDPKVLGKPLKPGPTPTPGIPDEETLRKMMSGRPVNGANVQQPPGDNQMRPMRKGNNRPVTKPSP